MKTPRPIRIEGDLAYIVLTKGHEAIIDAANVELVRGFCWQAQEKSTRVYALRQITVNGARVPVYLHRVILSPPDGFQVDHVNCNGLDNRMANLRVATASQNIWNQGPSKRNTTGFKGVYFIKKRQKYKAHIWAHGKRKYLGLFDDPNTAHEAYCEASKVLHGEFSRTNSPKGQP